MIYWCKMAQSNILIFKMSSQPPVHPEILQNTWASFQREMRLLGDFKKTNKYLQIGAGTPLGGSLFLLLLTKHLPLVLAIMVVGAWETRWREGRFFTYQSLNLNFIILRNSSALDLKHTGLIPRCWQYLGVNQISTDAMSWISLYTSLLWDAK